MRYPSTKYWYEGEELMPDGKRAPEPWPTIGFKGIGRSGHASCADVSALLRFMTGEGITAEDIEGLPPDLRLALEVADAQR